MVRDGGRGGDYKKERDLRGNEKVLYPDFSVCYTNLQVITWHGIILIYIFIPMSVLWFCSCYSYMTCNHWGKLGEGYTGLFSAPLCTIFVTSSEPIIISK